MDNKEREKRYAFVRALQIMNHLLTWGELTDYQRKELTETINQIEKLLYRT